MHTKAFLAVRGEAPSFPYEMSCNLLIARMNNPGSQNRLSLTPDRTRQVTAV
jgi:hypothetical protein